MKYMVIVSICLILYLSTLWHEPVVDEQWGRRILVNKPWRGFFLKLYGAGTFKNIYCDRVLTIVLFSAICCMINYKFGMVPALLYAANPINNQISMWMNGRRYAINILIVLLFLSFPVLFPLYFVTPAFQINAITSPLLFLFSDNWFLSIGFLLAIIPTYHFYKSKFHKRFHNIKQTEGKALKPQKLIIAVKTLSFYLINSIVPKPKTLYYPFLKNYAITEEGNVDAYSLNKDFWIGIITLLLFVVFGIYNYDNLIGWCVFAWFVTSVQWSNVLTLTQHLADRYCSLPAIFLMVIIGEIIGWNVPAFVAIFTSYVIITTIQKRMYENQTKMFLWNKYFFPESVEPIYFACITAIKRNDIHGAFVMARDHLPYNPKDFRLNYIIAQCLLSISPKMSKQFIDTAKNNIYIGDEMEMLPLVENLEKKYKKICN